MKTAWILTLVCLQALLANGLRGLDTAWVEPPSEAQGRWGSELVKTVSVGHLPSVIDWLLIRTLLDPAHSKLPKGVHPPAFYNLDLATDLDPAYFELYEIGAEILAILRDDGTGARDLLLKGVNYGNDGLKSASPDFRQRFWSRHWSLHLHLGYVYLFELDDLPRASEAFMAAARFEGAPPYLERLAKRLEKPGGKYEVGLRLLSFLISAESDDKLRARLEKKRDALYLSQYLFQLNDHFRSYLGMMPEYRGNMNPTEKQMQGFFRAFLRESRTPDKDPWGGAIQLDPASGKITSTTPREAIMGLY